MEYARILTLHHYDSNRKRFNSLAFKNSSPKLGGGISVICIKCANESSGSICRHICNKYTKRTNPAIFWKFSKEILPACRIELDDENGDECHYNIFDLVDSKAEKIFKDNHKGNLFICSGDNDENRTAEEIVSMIDQGLIS